MGDPPNGTRDTSPHAALRLALEAATPHASVAVLRGGAVLAEARAEMRPGGDEALMPAVHAALTDAGVRPRDLTAVVCGAGPGGFTSLRIAGAIAKGMAHATGCALLAVPSLALAAAGRGAGTWLVTLDALRGERYAAWTTVDDAGAVAEYGYLGVLGERALASERARAGAAGVIDANAEPPRAAAVAAFVDRLAPVDLDAWEPLYGRLAEAQARWELAHGRPLASALGAAADS